MSKRFTDTDKWNDPWFRKLPAGMKLFWSYIDDKCNAAGIWKVDMEQAEFFIGQSIDPAAALETFGKRVEVLTPEYWFITSFIGFQYDNYLTEDCRPHRPVIALLKKWGLWERVSKGFRKGTDTPKEQDKDKDSGFGRFWAAYPKKKAKGAAEKVWSKLSPSPEQIDAMIAAVNRAKTTKDWTKDGGQFIPHPATWLNAKGWEDEYSPMVERRDMADILEANRG